MVRRFSQCIVLALIFFSLAAVPTRVDSATSLVGVRIPIENAAKMNRASALEGTMIDYGAFLWTVMPPADLNDLDAAGVKYQSYENPYMLTLGGQSFDPLVTSPEFGLAWEEKSGSGEAELHLVQLHGPTKSEWLKALEADGLEIIQYLHPFTYVVWGNAAALGKSAQRDIVRWAGDYLPAYAVQPMNRTLSSEPILVRAMIYPQAGLTETIIAIENLGGSLVGSASDVDPAFDLASFILPGDQMQTAAALPGVYTIQPVPTDGGNRGEMSNQINAGNYNGDNLAFPGYLTWLSSLGLSGNGVIIANVDSGVDQNHPDLINRMLPCTGPTCGGTIASWHGTHTAGIMAGDASTGISDSFGFLRGLGMAPGANLIEQVYSPTYLGVDGMLTLMTQSVLNNAVISGNSWGPSESPLGYDFNTRQVDIGVRDADPGETGNQPLTYVLSIMNGNGGTSTQGTPDDAKNVFTIGSTYMQNSDNTRINDLSYNTAHGPALDGRNIPHMVAPGCTVDSTYYPGSGYALVCGTSMASPHVSGAVALFFERYRNLYGVDPSPALVKAAFLPVARDLAGNLDADGGILGHPFDSKQGWGRLDVRAVLNPPGEVFYFDQEDIFNETGQSWSVDISPSSPLKTLKAMLVWTDAPGHGNGGVTHAWNNDLDLTLTDGTNTYNGNNFGSDGLSVSGGSNDFMNNTEGIFLHPSQPGTFTVTVTAANINSDGIPNNDFATDQDFALVIYMAEQVEEPLYEYIFPLFYR